MILFEWNDLKILRVELDALDVKAMASLLSSDEQERAGRLAFIQDRERFICRRGMLRLLLSSHTNLEANKLLFAYSMHGKPSLVNSSIQFSLSHSQNVAVYVISPSVHVGIDIEIMRPLTELNNLAEKVLPKDVLASFHQTSAEKKLEIFFAGWTQLEARAKVADTDIFQQSTTGEFLTTTKCFSKETISVAVEAHPFSKQAC